MKRALIYIILIILILFLWQLSTINNSNLKLLISNPISFYNYFKNNYVFLFSGFAYTAYESLLGLLIAIFFSFVSIYVCLIFPKLFEFVLPIMIISQVIPVVTLAPLFIVLFGIGLISKIAMAVLMCFFPIFISLATGVNTIDKNYHNLFSIYKSSKNDKIFKLQLPLSMPYLFSGLKVSSTLAVIGAIVAEFNGAEIGLGKNLFLSAKRLDAELMINSIILSCLLGGGLYLLIVLLEFKLGKWYKYSSKL